MGDDITLSVEQLEELRYQLGMTKRGLCRRLGRNWKTFEKIYLPEGSSRRRAPSSDLSRAVVALARDEGISV